MGFEGERSRPEGGYNKRYWRGPGRARWELRPRAHPTAIYGSRLPFLREHSVTLRKPRRRLDEDEIGRLNEDDSRWGRGKRRRRGWKRRKREREREGGRERGIAGRLGEKEPGGCLESSQNDSQPPVIYIRLRGWSSESRYPGREARGPYSTLCRLPSKRLNIHPQEVTEPAEEKEKEFATFLLFPFTYIKAWSVVHRRRCASRWASTVKRRVEKVEKIFWLKNFNYLLKWLNNWFIIIGRSDLISADYFRLLLLLRFEERIIEVTRGNFTVNESRGKRGGGKVGWMFE